MLSLTQEAAIVSVIVKLVQLNTRFRVAQLNCLVTTPYLNIACGARVARKVQR